MLDQEPVSEMQNSLRWPWILMVIVLLAGTAITIRACRRDRPQSPGSTGGPAPAGQNQAPDVTSPVLVPDVPSGTVASPAVTQSIAEVKALVAAGDLLGARSKSLALLASGEPFPERSAVEDLLGQIHTNLVFSPAAMPEKTNHVIQAGERLDAIAKRYKTTMDLLKVAHGIKDTARIRKGDLLRPLTGVFRIEVRRANHELTLYLNDRFFKRYTVGTGKQDKTPTGSFVVVDRVRDPVWWHPDGRQIPFGDPENILGTRWLALKATGDTLAVKGYGIHGTWDEASVGKSESAGCIRMHNRDVEELFTMVPNGTVVQIADR